MAKNYLGPNTFMYIWQKITNTFVKKESGKGLSEKDFTAADKSKLDGLSNYSLPTASETVKGGVKVGAGLTMNGDVLSATGGGTADAVDWSNVTNKPSKLSDFTNDTAVQYDKAQTLTDGQQSQARANIGAGSSNFSGNYNDLSNKPTLFSGEYSDLKNKPDLFDGAYSSLTGKPTKLSDFTNDEAVQYTSQSLSDTQKTQARTNIGAGTSNFSGSYADLSNKPTLFSGSYNDLDNKPELFSGAYGDLTGAPSIPDSAGDIGAVATSEKGQANGVATLGSDGLVPSSQLPSYVDDVIEGYFKTDDSKFYKEASYATAITGETGKIYVDLNTNNSYRYGGSAFVMITSSDMVEISNEEIDNLIATIENAS